METKQCRGCKIKLNSSNSYYYPKIRNFICKKCTYLKNIESMKKYKTTPSGAESVRKASLKSYYKNKEKWFIRLKVTRAINKGIIKKPSNCEECGKKSSGHKLQGHHKDYTKPLEVVFLCYICHAKADKLLEDLINK